MAAPARGRERGQPGDSSGTPGGRTCGRPGGGGAWPPAVGSRATAAVAATRRSFLGVHLLLGCTGGEFVSMTDPPAGRDRRPELPSAPVLPVLAGPAGDDDVVLVSPIVLEDHPTLAAQSPGALFDSTEIDEILTLRMLTMTDEEKAEARATDPRAAQILDRCEQLSRAGPGPVARGDARPARRDGSLPGHVRGGRDTDRRRAAVPWWDPSGRPPSTPDRRGDDRRHPCQPGKPGAAAARPPGRRPGPLPRRADRTRHRRAPRRRRCHPRRGGARRRPGGRPARVVRPLPVLRPEELEPLGATVAGPDTRRETRS